MFLDYLERRPSAHFTDIDERTYALFRNLTLVGGSRGNDVSDALLAATALRHDALLVTADKALYRFAGLSIKLVGKS
jgi:predicted nucleic acid-binding protein